MIFCQISGHVGAALRKWPNIKAIQAHDNLAWNWSHSIYDNSSWSGLRCPLIVTMVTTIPHPYMVIRWQATGHGYKRSLIFLGFVKYLISKARKLPQPHPWWGVFAASYWQTSTIQLQEICRHIDWGNAPHPILWSVQLGWDSWMFHPVYSGS